MAYLTSSKTNYRLYLKAFHKFGRLLSVVDTLIESPEVSRIHAIIEWIDNAWYIRDLSKNGVWLNNSKICISKLYQLKINDQICFAEQESLVFTVENLDNPKDILIPYGEDEQVVENVDTPIVLEHYHFLPSETSPEIIIFYDFDERSWCFEVIGESETSKIADGELIRFSNSLWKLLKRADSSEKETLEINEQATRDLTFIFNISQDEELVGLTLESDRNNIDCDIRSHHYLTALLARYRTEDRQKQIPENLQGWRTIDQLSRDMGLSESHLNIQIHRARKQITDKLKLLGQYAPMLIERKKRQVRLATAKYKIFKGNTLECDSMIEV